LWRDREHVFGPLASTATLSRLSEERMNATPLPGIRAARADAYQRAWAGDIELAPDLVRDQPRPRPDALAQRHVLPHHAPTAAVFLLPHRAVTGKMPCTKHKIITVSPGASVAARAGRRRPTANVFTKIRIFIARRDL